MQNCMPRFEVIFMNNALASCPVILCKDLDQVKTQIFMFSGETGLSPLGRLRLGMSSDWWRDEKPIYCIFLRD